MASAAEVNDGGLRAGTHRVFGGSALQSQGNFPVHCTFLQSMNKDTNAVSFRSDVDGPWPAFVERLVSTRLTPLRARTLSGADTGRHSRGILTVCSLPATKLSSK